MSVPGTETRGCLNAAYSIPCTSQDGLSRKNAMMENKAVPSFTPRCMAGYVPDWSQDCTVFEHQDKATVAAAEAIGATVLQLLPSSQSEPRHLSCCHHHSLREREAALVLPVSTAISILAAQLLIQTSLLSRVWVVPVIPYFRSWGEETELWEPPGVLPLFSSLWNEELHQDVTILPVFRLYCP